MSKLELLIRKPERPKMTYAQCLRNQEFVYSNDQKATIRDIDYLIDHKTKSGYRYVEYRKDRGKYMVRYFYHGIRTYLGMFDTPREAAWALHEAIKDILHDEIGHASSLGEKSNKPRGMKALTLILQRNNRSRTRIALKRG